MLERFDSALTAFRNIGYVRAGAPLKKPQHDNFALFGRQLLQRGV
jgi:hypothetical protein